MTETDVSMYPKWKSPAETMHDAISNASGVVGIQKSKQENQLLQMQVMGRQGLQDAYQKAANPDGTINTNKLQQIIMQDPRTAWMAGDVAQQNLALNNPVHVFKNNTPGMIGAQQAGALMNAGGSQQPSPQQAPAPQVPQIPPERAKKMHQYLDTTISTFGNLMDDPKVTSQDVAKHAGDLVGDGEFLSPQKAAAEMANMPSEGPELQAWLKQHYLKIADQKQKLNQIAPMPPEPENGEDLGIVQVPDSSPDQTELHPEEGQQPQQQAQPENPVAPPPQQKDDGFIATDAPLGQKTFIESTAAAAGQRASDTIAAAADTGTRQSILHQILNLSESGVKTGPTEAWRQNFVGKMADVAGVLGSDWKETKDDVAKLQILQKFLARNITNMGNALGTPTNDKVDLISQMNPTDKHFPQALQELARYSLGQELAVQGRANAQDRMLGDNPTPDAQRHFEKEWRNNYDMNAYLLPLMSPEERKDIGKNMSPEEYDEFRKHRLNLLHMGALEPIHHKQKAAQ